jgi:thioredoxin-like negative regulator of GroEL
MKKAYLFCLLLLCQFSNANWITSFDDAKKMSLATNKFIIVDFWATWCGPCKKMDSESWSNAEVNQILEGYVQVKVDIDADKELAKQYGIESIPNMFIMDGNGKVVYTFSGYHDAEKLKRELQKFAFSTEFLSNDLINYFKMKNYNTAVRVFQKYLDYSLLVNAEVKDKILDLGEAYLEDAKKELSKKDASYAEKKQKLELLKLYEYAYDLKFDKVSKKLTELNEADVAESNKNYYNFLKYITAKALNSDDFASIEAKVKEIEGFDYFIEKANFILSKRTS